MSGASQNDSLSEPANTTHIATVPAPTIYSIGHSNHALETFLDLLTRHGIEVLVDTRTAPRSKWVPHFNVEMLRPAVEAAGIRFVSLGAQLGGRPDGEQFYDRDGHVLYNEVAQSAGFLEGLAKLERIAEKYRVAMFCSEEDPNICHRRLLIARVLAERGWNVLHIRGDGHLEPEQELQTAEAKLSGGQTALFEDEEANPWRSLHPIRTPNPIRSAPNALAAWTE